MKKLSPTVSIWISWLITALNLVVANFAMPYISPVFFLFIGCILASLCFVPHITRVNGWQFFRDKKTFWQCLGLGTLGTALPTSIFFIALNYTTPTNEAILNQFEIVYSIFLSWIFLHERPTKRQIAGSFLVVSGVSLLFWQSGFTVQLKGDLMVIGCLWMFQVSHIFAKKLPPEMDAQTVAAVRSLFALPVLFFLIIYEAYTKGLAFTLVPASILPLFFCGIINLFIGNIFWYYAIRNMDLGKATAIILSYPVMTFIVSVLLGMDKITAFKVIGLVLAMAGAYIVTGIVSRQGEKTNEEAGTF